MTTNEGSKENAYDASGRVSITASRVQKQTYEEIEGNFAKAIAKKFRLEFINRLDDIIVFRSLEMHHIMEIIDLQLTKVFARIEERGYKIALSDEAKKFIANKGFDKQFGARPLQRALQKYLEDPIADEILEGRTTEGDTLYVDYNEKDDKIFVNTKKKKAVKKTSEEKTSEDSED
jgi:ATP-dependent Clp protease ATP-binding subunit ClpC